MTTDFTSDPKFTLSGSGRDLNEKDLTSISFESRASWTLWRDTWRQHYAALVTAIHATKEKRKRGGGEQGMHQSSRERQRRSARNMMMLRSWVDQQRQRHENEGASIAA